MDIEKIEKDWQTRGFGFGLWMDPPGEVWKDYVHDTDELFMVISGKVVLEIKDKVFHLKPGEEMLIPAHALHTVRNIGKTKSRWLYGYKHASTRPVKH